MSGTSQEAGRSTQSKNATSNSTTAAGSGPAVYQPLQPSQIRVLHLRGFKRMSTPSGIWRKVVVADLEVIDLNVESRTASTQYRALSYCWNSERDRTQKFYMLLRKALVAVTFNLHSALSRLLQQRRFPEKARDKALTVPIWADAICINQSDTVEKAKQVELMTCIYAAALDVFAWLGPCMDRAGQNAIRSLTHAGKQTWYSGSHKMKDPRQSTEEFLMCISKCIKSIPWFHRVWTFQEAILGKKVIMQYGEVIFDLESLLHNELLASSFFNSRPFLALRDFRNVRESYKKDDAQDLLTLIVATSGREATLSHDLVYGVLGLYGGSLRPIIDYTRPCHEVYAAAALCTFYQRKDLEFLRYTGVRFDRPADFPLWIPYWGFNMVMPEPRKVDEVYNFSWLYVNQTDMNLGHSTNPADEMHISQPLIYQHIPTRNHSVSLDSLETLFIPTEDIEKTQSDARHFCWQGIALGRVNFDRTHKAATLDPFPPCTISDHVEGIDIFLKSPLIQDVYPNLLRSTKLEKFCQRLRKHDAEKCACWSGTEQQSIKFGRSIHAHIGDWVCLLHGSCDFIFVRPDCHVPSYPPWAASSGQLKSYTPPQDPEASSGVFALISTCGAKVVGLNGNGPRFKVELECDSSGRHRVSTTYGLGFIPVAFEFR